MDPIASDINVNTALPWSLVTSIRKPSLDTILEVSKAGQIQSDHPWLVAQQLLEEAEQTHHFLPILLVVSDGSDLKLSHWGGRGAHHAASAVSGSLGESVPNPEPERNSSDLVQP